MATAVIAVLPSQCSGCWNGDQLPESSALVVPRDGAGKSSRELLASAVPVKEGVETSVRLSEKE